MVESHYELNISMDGVHYAKVVIAPGTYADRAKGIAHMFRLKFPDSQGYEVSLSYIECFGKEVSF